MATCQFCLSWNAPLMMRPVRLPSGESVPLRYDGWLWWYLHVIRHQTPAQWGGDIEEYVADLRAGKSLVPPEIVS